MIHCYKFIGFSSNDEEDYYLPYGLPRNVGKYVRNKYFDPSTNAFYKAIW
jgi:hypothetical protein